MLYNTQYSIAVDTFCGLEANSTLARIPYKNQDLGKYLSCKSQESQLGLFMSQRLSVFLAAPLSTYSLSYTFIHQYLKICKHLAQHCTAVVGFIKAGHHANWQAVEMILPSCFDHPEEAFSYKEVQNVFACLWKSVSLLLKTWKPSMFILELMIFFMLITFLLAKIIACPIARLIL